MATQPELEELVERALKRELLARRGLRPHAQLGISPNAPPAAIEQAYARLRARYDPAAFAAYGGDVVGAAGQILELLRGAYEAMMQGLLMLSAVDAFEVRRAVVRAEMMLDAWRSWAVER